VVRFVDRKVAIEGRYIVRDINRHRGEDAVWVGGRSGSAVMLLLTDALRAGRRTW
jgi:hypothetical protein